MSKDRINATLKRRTDEWVAAGRWTHVNGKARNEATDSTVFTAPNLLDAAAGHMRDRAATYDKPEGERSMGKTVQAFNAISGRDDSLREKAFGEVGSALGLASLACEEHPSLTTTNLRKALIAAHAALKDMKPANLRESEGWLLMAVLKMVRSEQRGQPHRDSIEDLIAYAALFGEARIGGQ